MDIMTYVLIAIIVLVVIFAKMALVIIPLFRGKSLTLQRVFENKLSF